MNAARIAEVEWAAREVARATAAARRAGDAEPDTVERARAADQLLWAVAAWKRSPRDVVALRARRVRLTWHALWVLLDRPRKVDGLAAVASFNGLEGGASRALDRNKTTAKA